MRSRRGAFPFAFDRLRSAADSPEGTEVAASRPEQLWDVVVWNCLTGLVVSVSAEPLPQWSANSRLRQLLPTLPVHQNAKMALAGSVGVGSRVERDLC
jgi:hypothetical protein